MKKQYTKKQIQEAINYWQKQLKLYEAKYFIKYIESMIEDGKIEFNKKYKDLTKAFNDCISAYISNISKYDRKALQSLKETYNTAIILLSNEAREWFLANTNILDTDIDEFLEAELEWYN